MPNINLIGEEEEKERKQPEPEHEHEEESAEPQEPETRFESETFSLETQEYAPPTPPAEPKLAEPVTPKLTTPPPDLSSYRRPQRGSRASLFLVVGFLVVVVALVLFWQLQKDEAPPPGEPSMAEEMGEPTAGEPEMEPGGIAEEPVVEEPAAQQTPPPPPTPTTMPGAPAYAVETAEITAGVTTLLRTLPEDLNFTLISFTTNRFLLEYVASTEAAALSFADLLAETLPTGEVRVLAREQMATDGQSFQKVLLQGSVIPGSLGSVAGSIEYLDVAGIRRAVTQLARANGMILRAVETRPGIVDDGFELVPIDFRLSGKKASAAAFLADLGEAGLNLRVSKVVLVSADRRGLSDEEVNLAINANTYQPR